MDRGAWQATVHGVTKSQTGLIAFHMDNHITDITKLLEIHPLLEELTTAHQITNPQISSVLVNILISYIHHPQLHHHLFINITTTTIINIVIIAQHLHSTEDRVFKAPSLPKALKDQKFQSSALFLDFSFFFSFLARRHNLQNLSSPTRDPIVMRYRVLTTGLPGNSQVSLSSNHSKNIYLSS